MRNGSYLSWVLLALGIYFVADLFYLVFVTHQNWTWWEAFKGPFFIGAWAVVRFYP